MRSVNHLQIDRKPENSSSNTRLKPTNSICARLDFQERTKAEIILNALSVDKEPKRSKTKRQLSLDGTIIIANFFSDDQKSLMRSVNNFFDMCQLSRSCIDMASNYSLKPSEMPTKKKKNEGKK
uniref:Uncharacterized protein n=1 Tax=Globodera rostochiensis TaxID=31243 RepID=A0A914HAX4_GLORO